MLSQIRPALMALLVLTVLTGVVYPLAVTALASLIFPYRASGSLIRVGGAPVGSELIGQPFRDPGFFWPRPSATSVFPYNAAASSGSNLGPTSPRLLEAVAERVATLRAADPGNGAPVPVDLVTASASGLDPHISPAAARYQAARVARARGVSEAQVQEVVSLHTRGRAFGVLGEATVAVLPLNLELERRWPRVRAE